MICRQFRFLNFNFFYICFQNRSVVDYSSSLLSNGEADGFRRRLDSVVHCKVVVELVVLLYENTKLAACLLSTASGVNLISDIAFVELLSNIFHSCINKTIPEFFTFFDCIKHAFLFRRLKSSQLCNTGAIQTVR